MLYSETYLMTQPKGRRLRDESLRTLLHFGEFGINLLARRFRLRPGNPPQHRRAQDHDHADQQHERQPDVEPAPNDLAMARLDHVPELAGNLIITGRGRGGRDEDQGQQRHRRIAAAAGVDEPRRDHRERDHGQ